MSEPTYEEKLGMLLDMLRTKNLAVAMFVERINPDLAALYRQDADKIIGEYLSGPGGYENSCVMGERLRALMERTGAAMGIPPGPRSKPERPS